MRDAFGILLVVALLSLGVQMRILTRHEPPVRIIVRCPATCISTVDGTPVPTATPDLTLY